jgi:hypothetical protein
VLGMMSLKESGSYAQSQILFDCALQKWKSNPMHWCDYCKVWMQDTPTAKSTHERGMKHKENVARSKPWPPALSILHGTLRNIGMRGDAQSRFLACMCRAAADADQSRDR